MSSAPCCGGPLPPAFMGGVSTLKAGRLTRLQVLPIKNVRVQRDMGHDPEPVLGHEEPHGVYMCGHVWTCVHVTCTHARAHVYVGVRAVCLCACVLMHACVHVRICTHACVHIYGRTVCARVCMCTCVHVCVVCTCVWTYVWSCMYILS